MTAFNNSFYKKDFISVGQFSSREELDKIFALADKITLPAKYQQDSQQKVYTLQIPPGTSKEVLVEFNLLLKKNIGEDMIILLIPDGTQDGKKIPLPFGVKYTKDLKDKINQLLKRGGIDESETFS